MRHIKSSEAAKAFGQLVDDVQVEPVTINSYGRPVAVMYSYREAQEIERMKLDRLRQFVAAGIEEAEQGRVKPLTKKRIDDIKQRGRNNLEKGQDA